MVLAGSAVAFAGMCVAIGFGQHVLGLLVG
jgi:hypothetical protein